jgi:SAM-dependent methyltransferase
MNGMNTSESRNYTKDFFNEFESSSYKSAIKMGVFLKKYLNFKSVLDIGCGEGVWLKAFTEQGITDYMGVDGEYVTESMLKIPNNNFVRKDLKSEVNLNRKFDLAICLEVGEHLPDECSDNLVKSLTNHSEIILFSAALPGQTGTYHINEQERNYWYIKFKEQGYIGIDLIRKKLWYDSEVLYWYRQNAVLYVKNDLLNRNIELKKLAESFPFDSQNTRHPEFLFVKEKYSYIKKFLTNPIYMLKSRVNKFM